MRQHETKDLIIDILLPSLRGANLTPLPCNQFNFCVVLLFIANSYLILNVEQKLPDILASLVDLFTAGENTNLKFNVIEK